MTPTLDNPQPEPSWFAQHFPSHWPAQTDLLTWCHRIGPAEATLLIIVGIIYLMWGIHIYKILVMLNAALLGAWVGAILGDPHGEAVPGGIIGGISAAAVTLPLMKYAVAIMGGAYGALIGAAAWKLLAPPEHLDAVWAGALIGLLAFGLLSFLLFRGCLMMYMSLQGSVMLVFGVLSLSFQYKSLAKDLSKTLLSRPLLLPAAIFIPMLIGLIYQHVGPTAAGAAAAKKK